MNTEDVIEKLASSKSINESQRNQIVHFIDSYCTNRYLFMQFNLDCVNKTGKTFVGLVKKRSNNYQDHLRLLAPLIDKGYLEPSYPYQDIIQSEHDTVESVLASASFENTSYKTIPIKHPSSNLGKRIFLSSIYGILVGGIFMTILNISIDGNFNIILGCSIGSMLFNLMEIFKKRQTYYNTALVLCPNWVSFVNVEIYHIKKEKKFRLHGVKYSFITQHPDKIIQLKGSKFIRVLVEGKNILFERIIDPNQYNKTLWGSSIINDEEVNKINKYSLFE